MKLYVEFSDILNEFERLAENRQIGVYSEEDEYGTNPSLALPLKEREGERSVLKNMSLTVPS